MANKIAAIILLFVSTHFSQSFYKLEDTPPVNDGGDSRSVNLIDYDNDGDLDIFITNGPKNGENNFFYKNDGNGIFTKITNLEITNDNKPSDGSSWGDFNNDGLLDLFVGNWWGEPNMLYKQNGDNTFTLISEFLPSTGKSYTETGTWGNINKDGFLDLYVANSEGSSKRNFLFLNNAKDNFIEITKGSAVENSFTSRSVDWIDINLDGYEDLFIANQNNEKNNIYINDKNGNFIDSEIPPITTDTAESFSASWGDIDNDGDFDLFVCNFKQNNSLYLNKGDGTFEEMYDNPSTNDGGNSVSSSFGDADNDGDLDLFVTNAFVRGSKTKNFFYLNNGFGKFEKAENILSEDEGWTYGCAFGDLNRDGFLDLVIAKCHDADEDNAIYINKGNSNNWLLVDLRGTISNTSAIGAVVKIKTNVNGTNIQQIRRVAGQTGYCGQTLQLHFGLGIAEKVDSLTVNWPSGKNTILTDVSVNNKLEIVE